MWIIHDASYIGALDMDRGACPSNEAGFDACDSFGSGLKSSAKGPTRVLRRRCRSEGVDRSFYEHDPMQRSTDGFLHHSSNRSVPNKSHFTLNTALEAHERYNRECSLPIAENGDYIMAHHPNRTHSYSSSRVKSQNITPNEPLVTTLSDTKVEGGRLPIVEEFLEKFDYEMMELSTPKQPLKPILNNPVSKNVPQGILKKPKNVRSYQDSKEHSKSSEARRRQRASSESDHLYFNCHNGSSVPGHDRLTSNLKRAKDSTGTGYSYGYAIAALSPPCSKNTSNLIKKNNYKAYHYPHTTSPEKEEYHPNVLRTTAINNETCCEDISEDLVNNLSLVPTPACPTGTPESEIPVAALTVNKKTVKIVKKKPKSDGGPKPHKLKKMRAKIETSSNGEHDDGRDSDGRELAKRSPPWTMDADAVMPVEDAKQDGKDEAPPPRVTARPLSPTPTPQTQKKDENQITLPQVPSSKTKLPAKPIAASPVKKVSSKDNVTKTFLAALNTSNPFRPAPAHKGGLQNTELFALIDSVFRSCNKIFESQKEIYAYAPSDIPASAAKCLRPSLFPQVPPYLKFINHDETPSLKVPLPIQRHLKWKLTTITPIVVKKTLTNSGFRLVKSECDTAECPQEETVDWIGIWGKHMKSIMFRGIKDGQKMNHFPGTFQIGRKDRLWRNLQKLTTKFGNKEFGIMPKTYVLPHDLKLLKNDWEKHQENDERWIIKPPASARGTGIKVVSRWTQIPKKRSVVVQRYITKPYLINGSKFDMRLYVLVTSIHPLRIYLYKDGLARFASVKYNDEITSLNDRYMHLTNYSINKLSKNYTPNEDFSACEGHKWTLQTLLQYLKNDKNVDTKALWESMKDLVIKTIISGEASISSLTKSHVTSRYNCYELFGIDVLLDEDLKPWLLEVNISPSLHSASPLDIHVKGPMVTEVLNIAQYQIPTKINLESLTKEKPHKMGGLPYDSRLYTIYLSKEERDKHIIYTHMEDRDLYLRDIISTLTPDDVRHLIQAEDELTQAGDMERVFPTSETYKYLEFLTGPRYYNRLFDAWESRYGSNRQAGIQMLRELCDIGYHLEVPPVPLKNDVDVPSPPVSEQPSVHTIPSVSPSSSSLSTGRTCGDNISQPPWPQALEPRA